MNFISLIANALSKNYCDKNRVLQLIITVIKKNT